MASPTALQTLYRRFTNRKIDAKTLRFWEGALRDGGSSMADFEQFVSGSADYANHIAQLFKTKHIELLGGDPDVVASDAFMRAHGGRLLEEADVHRYIASGAECQEKYRTLVRTMGDVAGERSAYCMTEVEVEELVAKFVQDPGYGVTDLEADIERLCRPAPAPVAAEEPATEPALRWSESVVQEAPDCADVLTELQNQWAGAGAGAEALLIELIRRCRAAPSTGRQQQEAVMPAWVDEWEREAGRPMYVHEYLKHASSLLPTGGVDVRAAVKHHRRVYEHARKIQEKYADRQLDEYAFVRDHIRDMDAPEFLQRMLEDILRSDQYRDLMTQAIVDTHRRMYDAPPDAESTAYMFARALAEQMALHDERLRELVVTFRTECDAQAARVHELFLKVYGREPDAEEVTQALPAYRADPAHERVDARVVQQLMSGLEFHDVLKKKIKFHFWETHGSEIGASALYKVLNVCIASLPRCADMEQAIEMVRQAIVRTVDA
jgi:hypothetical protein